MTTGPARIAQLEEELRVPLAVLVAQAERVAIAQAYPLEGSPHDVQVVRLQDIPLAEIAADAESRALRDRREAEAARASGTLVMTPRPPVPDYFG